MDIKIFDSYNIRARVSVYIIIIAPIILTLYVVYEPVRSSTHLVHLLVTRYHHFPRKSSIFLMIKRIFRFYFIISRINLVF